MNSFEFYKGLYERELKRRIDLDSSINLPITIITLIFAAIYFLVEDIEWSKNKCHIEICVLVLNCICILISIILLMFAFNNFFKGFAYRNFAYTKELRTYEIELNKFIKEHKKDFTFEDRLIERINIITDYNIILNDKRSLYLSRAKSLIICSLFLTGILFIILFFKTL